MTKLRVLLTTVTLLVVGIFGYFAILYARGYRFNMQTLKFQASGILVVKTDPTGAQIIVNGELRGASDSNFSLSPGNYDLQIKKEGFLPWYKRITIDKETVTQTQVSLFSQAPSFSPVSLTGATNPIASDNFSEIAYAVLPEGTNQDKQGLWIIENINFPIGFSKDPRRITDGDLTGATWQFSPDGRQILLSTPNGIFQLDSGSFTPQTQRVNVVTKKDQILASWNKERETKLTGQISNLPNELSDILERKATNIVFSPDETKIMYTASASATISNNLIKPIPGSSTQKESRDIKMDHTYIYDIKEDRNFEVDDGSDTTSKTIFWLSNSQNIVVGTNGKIVIMDYDGTNKQTAFSGNYVAPFAFPYGNGEKLLILTNLGADSQTPNLYSISIK